MVCAPEPTAEVRGASQSPPRGKGVALKGRIALAVLVVGLMGVGAGGVMAVGGVSSDGASAAVAQYGHHCGKGTHYNPKTESCVVNRKHVCGKGTHWSHGKCVADKPRHFCGRGTHYNKKTHKCV